MKGSTGSHEKGLDEEGVISTAVTGLTLPDAEWDQRQHLLGGHTLQGRAWARFQSALGRDVLWEEGPGWSWIGVTMRARGVKYLYTSYGPTVAEIQSLEAAIASLQRSGKREDMDFVRCEPVGVPEAAVRELDLYPASPVQPDHTRVIDLTLEEAQLHRCLSSGHRNAVNGARRRGLEMTITSDPAGLEDFLRLLHISSGTQGFRAHPDAYYRTMIDTLAGTGAACLGFAHLDGVPVAGTIALDYAGVRSYAHAGRDPAGDKQQAATALVWELMMDAKSREMKKFDLWGVAPTDAPPDHPWAGFSRFKRAFGGDEVSYTGTWEAPLKLGKYTLYRMAKRWTAKI